MRIFLDTEFTDFIDTHLISLGMVSDRGDKFYMEVDFPIASCSRFVHETVLPPIGLVPRSHLKPEEIRNRLLLWFHSVRKDGEELVICYDYSEDIDLLLDALDYRPPGYLVGHFILATPSFEARKKFYEETGYPLHHALYDAMSNRATYSASMDDDINIANELSVADHEAW